MRQNSDKRSVWVGVFLAAVYFLLSIPVAFASPGSDWLSSQMNPDGSYRGGDDISTAYQSTAETLRAFHALGETTRAGHSSWPIPDIKKSRQGEL